MERALKLAGDNRAELEKVLEHYGKRPEDKLKLQSAYFLIANMPYHMYYEGEQLADYNNIFEALIRKKDVFFVLDSFQTKYGTFSWSGLNRKYDIQEITSDYLIQNIEWAFKVCLSMIFATIFFLTGGSPTFPTKPPLRILVSQNERLRECSVSVSKLIFSTKNQFQKYFHNHIPQN